MRAHIGILLLGTCLAVGGSARAADSVVDGPAMLTVGSAFRLFTHTELRTPDQGGSKVAVVFRLGDHLQVQIIGKSGLQSPQEAMGIAAAFTVETCERTANEVIFRAVKAGAGGARSLFYKVDTDKLRYGEYPASFTQCPPANVDPPWKPASKQ
jgi:hypothetical protein